MESQIILNAIKLLNEVYTDLIIFDLKEDEIVHYNGKLGVHLCAKFENITKYLFLNYQLAEDMCIFNKVADDVLHTLFRDELTNFVNNYERKEKLEKINEINKNDISRS